MRAAERAVAAAHQGDAIAQVTPSETLGVWASVDSRLAVARDVRAALALVSGGEAPLGIVYQTDAAVDKGVYIVGTFPASSHPPIVYPLAVTAASTNSAAKSYIAFLQSHAVEATIGLQGFALLRHRTGHSLGNSSL
jgi:molybdate transport system substrate-binding protein